MKKSFVTASVCILLILSLWVAKAQSPQPTLQPIERLTVVDAQGKTVGPIVGLDMNPQLDDFNTWVAFRFNQVVAVINVSKSGFNSPFQPAVYFQSVDCSGTPYIDNRVAIGMTPVVAVAFPGSTLYVANGSVPLTITAQSASQAPGTCEAVPGAQPEVLPATKGPDLSAHFTPPFSLR